MVILAYRSITLQHVLLQYLLVFPEQFIKGFAKHFTYCNTQVDSRIIVTFLNGIDFDILYRNLDDFTAGVASVVEGHNCQNAYTTCMWHNLITCKVLYDPSGALEAAKRRFLVPYPQQLRENILHNGWRLLRTSMPAYETQIIKAAKRGDLVSVNHRISAFLETYFDVLFAANSQTHPGEKRLIPLCLELCPLLPDKFEENLNALFSHMYTAPECIPGDLSAILLELEKII